MRVKHNEHLPTKVFLLQGIQNATESWAMYVVYQILGKGFEETKVKQFKATVYSLYLHDGYMWITEVLMTMVVHAESEAQAKTKVKSMTDLHFDLEEIV